MRSERVIETELSDHGLLCRMSAGDEEAFTLLYRRINPAIYRFALHMSGRPETAEDVTQEVFMSLIRDPKRFDPRKGSLTNFLFGVARNQLRKRWERDRRLVGLPDGSEELADFESATGTENNGNGTSRAALAAGNGTGRPQSVDPFTAWETTARVREAISTLPENYREAVVLCELEEMSYEEAAAALDCPVGTVRSRLHRAKALLLEKLRVPELGRAAVVAQRTRPEAIGGFE